MPAETNRSSTSSPFLVALVAWIIPGSGYLLLGQRARGFTIGLTILAMFFFGLLIGGVRCLEVPGYDAHGVQMFYYIEGGKSGSGNGEIPTRVLKVGKKPVESSESDTRVEGWSLAIHPIDEIRSKPWSIAQILLGPIDLLCDVWSVKLAQIDPNSPTGDRFGARSHSRVNELGILFTAVAGMLNLLAIIDSSHRASNAEAK